jgi:hypothetical protein
MKRLAPLVFLVVLMSTVGCGGRYAYYPVEPAGYRSPAAPPTAVGSAPAAAIDRAPAWRPFDSAHAAEHVVKAGDTTSQIAQARLGTVKHLPLLLLANPEVTNVHRIAAEDVLVIPGPGYFAGPFLVDGEKATALKLLRWSAGKRRAFLGVEIRDAGPARMDRFLLLEVLRDKSRVVFSSSNHRWGKKAAGRYRRDWTWRVVDLDGDGGLDLLATRRFGSGADGTLYACAFHSRAGKYTKYALAEALLGGEFPPGKKGFRAGTFTFTGNRALTSSAGRSLQPMRIVLRWTGAGFTRREVETGKARLVKTAATTSSASLK